MSIRQSTTVARFTACLGGIFLLGLLSGCGPATSAPPQSNDPAPARETPLAATIEASETWDAQYVRGAKVGYTHTRTTSTSENGRAVVQVSSRTKMTIKRDGQPITQDLSVTSTETPSGGIVRFQTRLSGGGNDTLTRGHYADDKLHVEIVTSGKTQSKSLPWNPNWGGFFVVEHSLERKPMEPGERRTLTGLVPFFLRAANIQMEALDYEITEMLGGTQRLLKIKETIDLGGNNKINSLIWTDRTGQTLKTSLLSGLGGTTYRTTKEVAMGELDDVQFDLFCESIVKVDRPLDDPHKSQKIVYRVHIKDGDPSSFFVSGLSQSVRPIDHHTAQVEVRTIRSGNLRRTNEGSDRRPTADDLAPNSLIQSDDRRVLVLAGRVVPDETDPWKIAKGMERFVHESIQQKDFSTALASAADVAKDRQGDCTEHAVLLAALCRARKIPARVAIGLVYSPRDRGFAYHMWNEVWINQRWIPLDATLGLGGIGAAHLKLSDSHLSGVDPYSTFLPVYHVLGRLEIEVVAAD